MCLIICNKKRWIFFLKHGRETLKDVDKSGRPKTVRSPEMIKKVLDMVMRVRRSTTRHIAQVLGISHIEVHIILRYDLKMTKVSARSVPRLLTPQQMRIRMNMSYDNFVLFDKDPVDFHARFVTVNETWVHHFTLETLTHPHLKKRRSVCQPARSWQRFFLDSEGILLMDFLEKGRKDTGQY